MSCLKCGGEVLTGGCVECGDPNVLTPYDRCMNCGTPLTTTGCPECSLKIEVDCPSWVSKQ